MDTANSIHVEVRVCYSFSKHNIFSTKAIESFIAVWYRRRDLSRKPATRFFNSTFKNCLFRFEHKDNANGAEGSSRSLVLLLFTRFSQDCTEISLFGSSKVYRSRLDILGHSARGPVRTFSDTAPSKGLTVCCQIEKNQKTLTWQSLLHTYPTYTITVTAINTEKLYLPV